MSSNATSRASALRTSVTSARCSQKSLLKGEPVQWEPLHRKIIPSLVAVRDRAAPAWPDVSPAIVTLMDNLEPANRPRAIAFIAAFPDFWPRLQEPTRTALQEIIDNADPAVLADYRILAGVTVPQFRAVLLPLIAGLNREHLAAAIASQPLAELWPRAVEEYQGSGSWRDPRPTSTTSSRRSPVASAANSLTNSSMPSSTTDRTGMQPRRIRSC
ncbi:hypothetical protein QCM77_03525 [Bradyrhizobium sp. SSUT18]|uniref:hypothetical protein n=1 Tax=Bradyrhizobium sp. SSUT18 TaxID=3040602 RepID=UPI00244CB6E1|nr:hypothetical protein [Bradyrhizobium sp. SSUT18]MDH2399052.1 hypothetical protein [Bradyrhizobium sp. SSUT18]